MVLVGFLKRRQRRRRDRRSLFACCRLGIALLLAGYVLFSHGCHGDEDHELFAWLRHGVLLFQPAQDAGLR